TVGSRMVTSPATPPRSGAWGREPVSGIRLGRMPRGGVTSAHGAERRRTGRASTVAGATHARGPPVRPRGAPAARPGGCRPDRRPPRRISQRLLHFWLSEPEQFHSWSAAPLVFLLSTTSTHLPISVFTRSCALLISNFCAQPPLHWASWMAVPLL